MRIQDAQVGRLEETMRTKPALLAGEPSVDVLAKVYGFLLEALR